uniref:Phospholipid/glycerol acyltransferase domain-containing protein n=1 Tax=Strigamia maritima TaxID=126957 RepID=T1IT00_STRMM
MLRNGIISWRCRFYQKFKCKARVVTEGLVLVEDKQPDHTHSGNVATSLARKAVGQIKEKMNTLTATPSSSQASVLVDLPNSVLMALPKQPTLTRALQSKKQKFSQDESLPAVPKDVHFDIPEKYRAMVLYDSGTNNVGNYLGKVRAPEVGVPTEILPESGVRNGFAEFSVYFWISAEFGGFGVIYIFTLGFVDLLPLLGILTYMVLSFLILILVHKYYRFKYKFENGKPGINETEARQAGYNCIKWFHKVWFGIEMLGLENIPLDRPILLLLHHGIVPFPSFGATADLVNYTKKRVFVIVDRAIEKSKILKEPFHMVDMGGYTREDCLELFKNGHHVCVAPGGFKEAKHADEYYKFPWETRRGFARLAKEAKVVILPLFCVNLYEAFWVPFYVKLFFRNRFIPEKWNATYGSGGLPVKLTLLVGEPVDCDDDSLSSDDIFEKALASMEQLRDANQRIPGNKFYALLDRFRRHMAENIEIDVFSWNTNLTSSPWNPLENITLEEYLIFGTLCGLFVIFILPFCGPIAFACMLYFSGFILWSYKKKAKMNSGYEEVENQKGKNAVVVFFDWIAWLWHGYKVEGWDNLPDGPAILVSYHGRLAIDGFYFMMELHKRDLRSYCGIISKNIALMKGWRRFNRVFNLAPFTRDECFNHLKEGGHLSITPGGFEESRYSDENYRTNFRGKSEFAQLALDANVPIIPIFTKNIQEAFWIPWFVKPFVTGIFAPEKIPFLPIGGGLPVKLITYIGKPVDFDDTFNADELANQVCVELQAHIDQHQKVPGNIIRALLERLQGNEKKNMETKDIEADNHLVEAADSSVVNFTVT